MSAKRKTSLYKKGKVTNTTTTATHAIIDCSANVSYMSAYKPKFAQPKQLSKIRFKDNLRIDLIFLKNKKNKYERAQRQMLHEIVPFLKGNFPQNI